ncbi:MAG: MBL fold metallo-hydrolase [Candidatus Magasanikiibacteriota bacterium]
MKITKYPQSCFLIETKGQRFIIDSGNMVKTHMPEFNINDWQNITAILITHKHSDHCDPELIKEIQNLNPNVPIYTNSEMAGILKENDINTNIVKEGDILEFSEIRVEVTPAKHGYIYLMKGGGYPNENVGYIFDDGEKRVYHTSDTIMFEHNLKADIVLAPICGHNVVLEPTSAIEFADHDMHADLLIPCHYEHKNHPIGTDKFEMIAKEINYTKYKILKNGETLII